MLAAISNIIRPTRFSRVWPRSMASIRPLSSLSSYLVSPKQLHEALQSNPPNDIATSSRVILICGSWFLPNDPAKRTGVQVFRQAHIPTARFFDLDKVADTSSPYPHMLPSPKVFQDAMSRLGVRRDDTLVVYDSQELGIFSGPRVAWTLQVFGHPTVHLLNNFKAYVEEGYPTESGEQQSFDATEYPLPTLQEERVIGFEELKTIVGDYNKEGREEVQVLDARSAGRWHGTDPEPRPGLSSGHMPGSISVPITDLIDPATKTLLPAEQLKKVFEQKGIDPTKPIVSSCGTGVTATVIDAALKEAGYGDGVRRIYDGSWTEWAQRVQPNENLIIKSQ